MPARAVFHLRNSSQSAQHYPNNNTMPNKEISETAKLYAALFKQVREKFDAEEFDECDRLALWLLTKADLPVIIRTRCHMMLASAYAQDTREKMEPKDWLGHADAAVEIRRKAREQGLVVKDKSIEDAEKIQERAKQSYQELVDAGAHQKSDRGESRGEGSEGANNPGKKDLAVPALREVNIARVASGGGAECKHSGTYESIAVKH
ncbi:hypothetical protein M409DRAFT_48435 [Zasmidium cellare ATCC 36951]|uniref:Uncharacterized protein n=1 Tax=Zasmidium cellare ATCC 36951 TaxID=1080233 RepID=A0A6A6D263_ZASCE|nr:uncharacterized protein M409DRAFT_48435 [Zasmidium cellare ATCC 36951]KAF2173461.1 hypothetical protein M409DRAFT_48435 [Zasmidium cellare ATCC 36951]